MSHPIKDLMDSSIQNLHQLVDVNTIIGDPVTTPDGTDPFGGGAGAGVTIQPIAFLVIKAGGGVQLLQLATSSNTADKVVNLVPEVIDKITGIVQKSKEEKGAVREEPPITL